MMKLHMDMLNNRGVALLLQLDTPHKMDKHISLPVPPQPRQVRPLQPPIDIPDRQHPPITEATRRVTARGSVPAYGLMWMPSPHGIAMQMPMQPAMMMQMPSQQGLAMHTHLIPQYLCPHGRENTVAGSSRHTTKSYGDNSRDGWMSEILDPFADYPWYDQGHE